MNREDAKAEIKARVSCLEYLEKSKSGLYCCPVCNSGKGAHGTGAVEYYAKTNTWYCHACGAGNDVISLCQKIEEIGYNEALSLLADKAGIEIDAPKKAAGQESRPAEPMPEPSAPPLLPVMPLDIESMPNDIKTQQEPPQRDYTYYFEVCRERLNAPEAKAYLYKRGISLKTAAACNIGYDPAADPAAAPGATTPAEYKAHPCPRLIIPTSANHYVGRRIDGGSGYEKINPKGSTPGIFNESALYTQGEQPVFVLEGAFDALSVMEVGYPAIALNSAGNIKILLEKLKAQPTEKILVLCADNDEDEATAERVKNEFKALADGLKLLNVDYVEGDINAGYKDANEALTGATIQFKAAVEKAAQQAARRPDNVQSYIDNIMGGEIAQFKREIKTGYDNLDDAAGGLYTGLYVVAAISSLGKTTFCHQLADQIAEAGNDVLFFSMEQSRLEMVSKSLSRRTAQKDLSTAVTSLAIRRGYLPEQVQKAAVEYKAAVEDRLSIIEGNFDCDISFIGEYIRRYMKRNPDSRPVIFIDYLQILQPPLDDNGRRQSAKDATDITVTTLKRLSRELNITIFAISSVNRANYLTPIDFESLKESGGIEFTADVVWGLQLQCLHDPIFDKANNIKERRELVRKEKGQTPRKVELVCLKNRYGKPNFSCEFDYYPAADLFVVSDDFIEIAEEKPVAFVDRRF